MPFLSHFWNERAGCQPKDSMDPKLIAQSARCEADLGRSVQLQQVLDEGLLFRFIELVEVPLNALEKQSTLRAWGVEE